MTRGHTHVQHKFRQTIISPIKITSIHQLVSCGSMDCLCVIVFGVSQCDRHYFFGLSKSYNNRQCNKFNIIIEMIKILHAPFIFIARTVYKHINVYDSMVCVAVLYLFWRFLSPHGLFFFFFTELEIQIFLLHTPLLQRVI